uniref:Uncharacterized protein n=1 Tax=Drosophila melanogaster TaxID=7227 RepID=M9NFN6_DROME|nr:uncharacterized protein Dmel_CG43392 [Drosophila melanogaster]AFH04549.1 uncharacterized protein Dmel_CG43392 [Drosophila melanogaster]|eukprot:NP_001246878.1 uncharacterized protein Dmel_CG43392 [Drosophila melanogaster]
MKISLVHFCIITLVLLVCCFTVEVSMSKTKKCKPPLKLAPKKNKCLKVKPKKKPDGATGSTPAAGAEATTAAPT